MNLQTSHLAAALMSGSTYINPVPEPPPAQAPAADDIKMKKPAEPQKEPIEEEKEEIASGEDFSDEVNHNLRPCIFQINNVFLISWCYTFILIYLSVHSSLAQLAM